MPIFRIFFNVVFFKNINQFRESRRNPDTFFIFNSLDSLFQHLNRTATFSGKTTLAKQLLKVNDASEIIEKAHPKQLLKKQTYNERDLHKLLSSYLKNKNIYAKTILHEESKNSKDDHQKWIHPDMIGIEFLNLTSKINKPFMKILNKSDTFKLTISKLLSK